MTKHVQYPELHLARQLITISCLDYLALSFPDLCPIYLRRWYRQCYGNGGDLSAWVRQQKQEVECYLAGKGAALADLVEMDNYIREIQQAVHSRRGKIWAAQLEHGQYTFRKH